MSDSIKVAVRVRPFASYEKEKGAKCVVAMYNGNQTSVTDPSTGKEKSFTFDYSFNSHVDSSHPDFASNDNVYEKLGVSVLNNAWDGFNCCLFAYGQTGSGKSYSMMGYGEDYGIIPRALRRIFERIKESTEEKKDGVTYRVECSMLEIYNEQIRDLFSSVPRDKLAKGGLKVRDSAQTGPFVAGLTKNAVNNYLDVEKLMDLGAKARTVAATNMNATSSRAHTVFTVVLTQEILSKETNKVMKKMSKINLVDLAGSERANATGATGDRLKEGCAINQSLSSLGNVINALAKQSEGGGGSGSSGSSGDGDGGSSGGAKSSGSGKRRKKKGKMKTKGLLKRAGTKMMVPYRASKLTHLLKQSLGGNSKTIMIAAISPADVNYKETLGTLQYADRAKQIKNKAVVNEDPTEKMIRGLKEELERLRKQLQVQQNASSVSALSMSGIVAGGDGSGGSGGGGSGSGSNGGGSGGGSNSGSGGGGGSNMTEDQILKIKKKFEKEREAEMLELREQMIENERLMKEQAKTWTERLKETELAAAEQVKQLSRAGITVSQGDRAALEEKRRTTPHLFNLNEDPLMSGVVCYFLEERITRIGRKDAKEHNQHICLSGLSIESEHAIGEFILLFLLCVGVMWV